MRRLRLHDQRQFAQHFVADVCGVDIIVCCFLETHRAQILPDFLLGLSGGARRDCELSYFPCRISAGLNDGMVAAGQSALHAAAQPI
jgi:hypothetical protein